VVCATDRLNPRTRLGRRRVASGAACFYGRGLVSLGITRLAHRYAVNRDYAEDVGCLPVLGAVAVGIVIALLYGRVVVAGDPPTWFVDPPSLAGLILDDPPTWLLVTERIAECVTGTVIVFAGRRR
jgi:hypothetical protein